MIVLRPALYLVLRQGVRVDVIKIPFGEAAQFAYNTGAVAAYVYACDASEARARGLELIDHYERDSRETV